MIAGIAKSASTEGEQEEKKEHATFIWMNTDSGGKTAEEIAWRTEKRRDIVRVIDAEELKRKYPGRKSLNAALDDAEELSISDIIENVKAEMCNHYCKMPEKYTNEELFSEDAPCRNCPLDRL